MPTPFDLFLGLMSLFAYFSILFASVYSLAAVLWQSAVFPQGVAVALSIFSISMLGLAYADNKAPILLLFTVTTTCWSIIAIHQSLGGGK
jgi:hypothetical protein